jgi:Tol biopolymer transport system component
MLLVLTLIPLIEITAADESMAEPMIGNVPVAKILFLGNSITLHAPAPKIGWTGNWGMAASSQEKDFVHLLVDEIASTSGDRPTIMVRNIADFEQGFDSFDIEMELQAELEFRPDLVIVAIGENMSEPTTGEEQSRLAVAFAKLLEVLDRNGRPAVLVRSSFWASHAKDGIMRKASEDVGATFVDIGALAKDHTNAAKSERRIDHAGVGNHPGDKGMISQKSEQPWPTRLIGYTEFRTNLTGGRHANVRTMRAKIVNVDGTGTRELANELIDQPDSWTQFAGWSPDGKTAVIARGWQSPTNAAIEERQKGFHFIENGWSLDSNLVDLASGEALNVTGVDRVSFYNGGLFYWPGDPAKLGFTALVDGNSHPFKMGIDGHNKVDLTSGSKEFTYGFSSSPNGSRIAYHKNYQVYVADANGENAVRIETSQPFNFSPSWSPDGKWVLFVSGQHYNCHPHVVRADGTGLKKLADRNGYRGVIEFLDVPDFHDGSSDVPVWSADGKQVFFTAKFGANVELCSVDLDGTINQLTNSPKGTLHYHPTPSPDGNFLIYGSKRSGVRQLYIRRLADGQEKCITDLGAGSAAMWPHWQPTNNDLGDTLEIP